MGGWPVLTEEQRRRTRCDVLVAVRMPAYMRDELRELAESKGTLMSVYARQVIRRELENWKAGNRA